MLYISLNLSSRKRTLILVGGDVGIDRVVIVFFAMVVILPLCLKRNIRELRWSSTISVGLSGSIAA
jgi:amino acid permease